MIRYILILLGYLHLGCNGPWEPRVNSDSVWCGPHLRIDMQRRDLNDLTGRLSQNRWLCDGDSVGALKKVVNFPIDYLEDTGVLGTWPSGTGNAGCGRNRIPPYRLYLVSLNPSIVLLVEKKSIRDRPPLSGQILNDCRLEGALEFGTNFDCGGEILWFSPDEKVGPLPLDGYDARIELPDGYIQLIREGDRFRVERL